MADTSAPNFRRYGLEPRPSVRLSTVNTPTASFSAGSAWRRFSTNSRTIDRRQLTAGLKRIARRFVKQESGLSNHRTERSLTYETTDPPASRPPSPCPGITIRPCPAVDFTDRLNMIEGTRRGSHRPSVMTGGLGNGGMHRPSMAESLRPVSVASNLSDSGSQVGPTNPGEERTIASGNGVSLSISLAEPVLFLQGFDQSELANQTTTMLRGSFHLRVSKSAKIKAVSLSFRGRAETDWPEGVFFCSTRLVRSELILHDYRHPPQENRLQRQGQHH